MADRETGVGSEAPPLQCFIAYNRSYKDVAERVAKLAKSLGIDPRIYDEPDPRAPLISITEGLEQADFLIALLGPDFDHDPTSTKPAEWPKNEAVRAHSLKRPVVPLVHEGTEVHQSVLDAQFYPSFDFRDTESYADNVHKCGEESR